MANRSFGISVPEGHIEVREAAAEKITLVARAADRAGAELRKAAKVDGWEGDASKAFIQALSEGIKPAHIAEQELPRAAKALEELEELAHDLRVARHATHAAVEQARAADRQRQHAEHDATSAQTRVTNRNAEAAELQGVIDRATARQDHVTEKDMRELLRKVRHAAAEAEHDLAGARKLMKKAEHDLEEAQHDGARANNRYEAACQRAAKVLQAVGAAAPGTANGDTAITWRDAYAVMRVGWKVGDQRVSGREVAAGLLAVFHAKQRIPVARRGDFRKQLTPELTAIMRKERKQPKWKDSIGQKGPIAYMAVMSKGKFLVGQQAFFPVAHPVTGGTPAPPE